MNDLRTYLSEDGEGALAWGLAFALCSLLCESWLIGNGMRLLAGLMAPPPKV